ncbi:insulinase family protein [Shewanella sp. NIFS-20-20]|uniref:insulinase family protein n=1 Tax=Shewanella sp. NIFS-20-20 TaxID=2853806 RepID=UPI00210A9460|nr:insulinase family protein [Shewanella sp. NIFS-20-20]
MANALIQINTSHHDNRQYGYLTLPNQLRVLLVADEQSSQAAASMAVNVGHFDDPAQRPGMAHFLEHMLFLGTDKFPDPAEYHHFINQHGGSNNAWTGTEHTNFFYSIHASQLEESLDRFSQFFIAPTFNCELVDRERQAIESEFSLKLKDDIRRIYQVQKATINQSHPFSHFSVGNLETLHGDQRVLRQELLDFYQQHYSANLMTLCIVAPLALDKLEQLAMQYFAGIINKNLKKNYPNVTLVGATEQNRQIDIVPLKDQKRLTLSFALGGIDHLYKTKPLTFISHLLGNESRGSLLHCLKELGLASNLSAGGGVNGYNFKDYCINIQLTDAGLKQIDDIVTLCFEAILLIKTEGLIEWRYQERATLLTLAYKYQEPVRALDLASHLSINMQHYPADDTLFGDYRMDGLDSEQTRELLDLLAPDNLRLQLVAPDLSTEQQAPWYFTPYRNHQIDPKRLARWQVKHWREQLSLAPVNPFIPDVTEPKYEANVSPVPTVIAQGKGYRLWHKKDDEFNVPKAHMFLSLDSECASKTVTHAALTRLYVEMLLDYLTEDTYQAEVAGLGYHIYSHQGGITLHLSGYTGKQNKLLELLIQKARERNFCRERFALIKRQLMRSWQNQSQAKPISQLFTSLAVTLQKRSYEPQRMAEALADIEVEDLHSHISAFFEKIHLEGLIYGDWLAKEAQSLAHHLKKILTLVTQPSDESSRELINLAGCGTLYRELDIDHQDSSIIVYYQSEHSDPRAMAIFSLLNHSMSSNFFHKLRTEKQLGYMVGTGYLPLHRHPGIIFYIQSPASGPVKLLQAIDEFIADFTYAIMQITTEQWQSTKQGLINQVMEHDANLKTRSQRYWASLGHKDYAFNQREHVVADIEKLTRADLISFIIGHMRTQHADRLVLHSTGLAHQQQCRFESSNKITDLRNFKEQSNLFLL